MHYELNSLTDFIKIASVRWRQDNKHNYTALGNLIKDINKIKVGKYTYGKINFQSFENPNEIINR
jgi:hypothetical protein